MDSRVTIIITSAKSFKKQDSLPHILNINSCIIIQDPVRTLARFMSGHHGKILPGRITNDLSEPYGNLGKILVWSVWPNLAFKTSHKLDKILVQFFLSEP